MYCPICDTDRQIKMITRNEVYPVRDEPIKIDAKVPVCSSCGEEIFDEDIEDENLENAYKEYRSKYGIVAPDEIRQLRRQYGGISQRTLAHILGWGEATIARYENGSLPDDAHNRVLQVIKTPFVMRRFIDICNNLSAVERQKIDRGMEDSVTHGRYFGLYISSTATSTTSDAANNDKRFAPHRASKLVGGIQNG